MTHVAIEVAEYPVVQLVGHATGLEVLTTEFLAQLAQVVAHGHVFGTEKGGHPAMFEAKAKHHLVNKFGLSATGDAGYHTQTTGLEGDALIELLKSRIGTGRGPFEEERAQVFTHIGGGVHAFERNLGCAVNGIAKCLCTVFQQHIVGVLAIVGKCHHAATLLAQPTKQFVPQFDAHGVVIYRQINNLFVVEVRLHKRIQPGKILVGPTGNADHFCAPGGEAGQRIGFALHDDALLCTGYAVDVVRNEACTGVEFESLVGRAVFGIHHLAIVQIIKANAAFRFATLGDVHACRGEVHLLRYGSGNASCRVQPFEPESYVGIVFVGLTELLVTFGEGKGLGRLRNRHDGYGAIGFLFLPLIVIIGHYALPVAMKAAKNAFVEVNVK